MIIVLNSCRVTRMIWKYARTFHLITRMYFEPKVYTKRNQKEPTKILESPLDHTFHKTVIKLMHSFCILYGDSLKNGILRYENKEKRTQKTTSTRQPLVQLSYISLTIVKYVYSLFLFVVICKTFKSRPVALKSRG